MPTLTDRLATGAELNRIFAYGPAQSRKTWWAATIAEAGFNVLLIDGENKLGVLRHLSPEAQKRIYVIDAADTRTAATYAFFWTLLLRDHQLWFNETTKSIYTVDAADHIHIDIRNWDNNHVIICDSYTALAISVTFQFSLENGIDLSEAKKQEWPGYGWAGRLLTWMLESMNKLPCHLICIGHATQYEKKRRRTDGTQEVEWSRRQPVSSSGPHGMQVGREFHETYYMYQHESQARIEPFGNQWADGGSRFLPRDKIFRWEELQAHTCFDMAGTPRPPADLPYIEFPTSQKRPLSEQLATRPAPLSVAPPLQAGTGEAIPIQPGGLAKLGK